MRGAIIERLMCDLEVDLAAVARDRGRSAGMDFADEIESLRRLADEGLSMIDGRRLRVSPEGRPFVRLVAAAFDAALWRTAGLPIAHIRHAPVPAKERC
jgi:oxygen-independent coproporphyrinogen III oxidase